MNLEKKELEKISIAMPNVSIVEYNLRSNKFSATARYSLRSRSLTNQSDNNPIRIKENRSVFTTKKQKSSKSPKLKRLVESNRQRSLADNSKQSEQKESTKSNVQHSTDLLDIKSFNSNSFNTLLAKQINEFDLKDLDYQRKCLDEIFGLLSSPPNSLVRKHTLKYLTNVIKRDLLIFPKLTPNFHPICKFNSQGEPKFQFYFQNPKHPSDLTKIIRNVNQDIISRSKLIYSYVCYFQSTLNNDDE